ncbi:hypothetical protein ALC60_11277 [Trachymyrmex zeteki]|uniref:Myb/SANT-like DNA-binding domain-containing protein n=1 Tax=Mycetomoellerius zeteki TaxID=64791 RepID=A0A151WP52_9HYME|nr:hypothetical protein ALC60_11277 [Trachymyrmex zeteki]
MSATNESCSNSSYDNSTNEKSNKWTHNATVALIYEYRNKISMFQSSTIRKEAALKIISTNMGQKKFYYTPKQCEFKFKNKLDQIFVQLDDINKKREKERYMRHKELVAIQENTIKVFSEKMDKLIDKL